MSLSIALLLVEAALSLATPWFAGTTAKAILAKSLAPTLLVAWFAVIGLQAIVSYANRVAMGRLGARVSSDLASRVYEHLQALPLTWHQMRRRGEVLSLLIRDIWRITAFLSGTLSPLLPLLFTFLGAMALLMWIEPDIGLVVALSVPVFGVIVRLLTRRMRPLADQISRADAERTSIAEQGLAQLPIVKAFTREPEEAQEYREKTLHVRSLEMRQLQSQAVLTPVLRVVSAAGVLLLLWVASARVGAGSLTAPELVSVLLYGFLLTQPISQLGAAWGQTQAARGAATRLIEVLGTEPESDKGVYAPPRVDGGIAFESVGFAHADRETLFGALSLTIAPGETVALTGVNGAGKTTLANLLLRFLEPTSGRITIDGVDICDFALANLRRHIGLVSQRVLLFNSTLAHNIGYGRLDATREEIVAAAKSSHAHEFIAALPNGYDSVIGDEGVKLSGGQRQRVALARALLKDPSILILDEATAMFDPEGERGFIAECHELLRTRTVILITHRPASLALADRIYRLEAGKLEQISPR